ncbi:MAG: sulfite exporter TauE/SafE family protein [Kiritimatiellia bacterium]
MMRDVILAPLLAGLSAGLFCCASCYPFLLPLFAAENRTPKATLRIWLQFLLGRLAGYVLFGAAVGWIGERCDAAWFSLASTAGMMLLALVLIFYAVGFWRPSWSFCAAGTRRGAAAPAVLGFLMGLQACPPFLLSVAYVLTLHSMLKGMAYFLVFFCATSVYFVPLLFAGLLGRMKEFRWAARASALAVGALFLAHGAATLYRVWAEAK